MKQHLPGLGAGRQLRVVALDGRWRALDGRALHAAAAARYNTRLEAQLVHRLGVTFTDRASRPGLRPVRELSAIPAELIAAWSTRRAQITTGHAQLLKRFRATYGREPTTAASGRPMPRRPVRGA